MENIRLNEAILFSPNFPNLMFPLFIHFRLSALDALSTLYPMVMIKWEYVEKYRNFESYGYFLSFICRVFVWEGEENYYINFLANGSERRWDCSQGKTLALFMTWHFIILTG